MASSEYLVSARKYRPATFETVVGQRALTATLKNAITSGKLAQAYLFCGPRGVGKTSCARIFAKTINCMNPTSDGEACGECESCRAIDRGNSFNLVELDAASNNSVDDIRNITDQVNIPAQNGRYRVFIIDEVHMLSNSAFNAFLKTLEEPPRNVVFILATTERHKVIPTILSRCQVYDFRRITVNDIIDHLKEVAQKEGVKAEREALGVIALKADGAMRDALSIFDQVVASTHGDLTYQSTIEALNVLDQDYYFNLVDIFRKGDVADALLTFKQISDKGFDAQFFINGLSEHIRNLMVCADPRTLPLLETSEEWAKKYRDQSPSLPVEWYYNAIKILNDADFNYRMSGNKRLLVELALIRLSRLLSHSSSSQGALSNQNNLSVKPSGDTQAPFVTPGGEKPQHSPGKKTEASDSNRIDIPRSKPSGQNDDKHFSSINNRNKIEKPKSFRLNNINEAIQKGSEEKRNADYSIEDFKSAWEQYAATHVEQRILVSAMRAAAPQPEGPGIFKVRVDHPAQKQAFEMSLLELTEYLKQKLDNDNIKIIVEVSEKTEKERGLNPKEFLKLAVDENPELANFLKTIDAELI